MLKLEILSLIKEYKNSSENERENILTALGKLVNQNESETESFYYTLDSQSQNIIELAVNKIKSSQTILNNASENDSEVETIKRVYSQWRESFQNNDRNISENEFKLVYDLVNYYFPVKVSILKKILDMKFDDNDFELFKNQISNELRARYVEAADQALKNPPRKLSFRDNLEAKFLFNKFLSKLNRYEFDHELYTKIISLGSN